MLDNTVVPLEIFLDILRALATCLFEVRGSLSLLNEKKYIMLLDFV